MTGDREATSRIDKHLSRLCPPPKTVKRDVIRQPDASHIFQRLCRSSSQSALYGFTFLVCQRLQQGSPTTDGCVIHHGPQVASFS